VVKVVRDNGIEMTRGDSLRLKVSMTVGGAPYIPETGDVIRFALKREKMDGMRTRFVDDEPLVLKNIPTDTMMLELDPEDTKPYEFGDYVYDIQITRADGFVSTFIADARLTLCREVD